MTLRTTPEQDAAIEALAKRWGVSKTEAILRAVEEASNGNSADDAFMAAYEDVSTRYRNALDRLGSV